jgi:hypothetical protein
VDPRAGLDDVEKRKFLTLPELELRPLSCPGYSQSLYRLCLNNLRIHIEDYAVSFLFSLEVNSELVYRLTCSSQVKRNMAYHQMHKAAEIHKSENDID